MPDLLAFQRDFGHALLDTGPLPEPAPKPLDVVLKIHRNTVMKGLVDAMVANYPTVHQLVGDEWFHAAAIAYVRRHPARSPVLALYGEAFPSLLAAFEPAGDLPYLADVATLDRLWIECLMALEARALAPSSLTSPTRGSPESVRVSLHPATRLAWVRHSAATIWVHHRTSPSDPLEIEDAEEGILLTRRKGTVAHTLLDRSRYTFLRHLSDGALLGAAAEMALQHDPAADVAGVLAQSIVIGAFADLAEASE